MPLFPILDTESLVQEQDKTRLDASKSYAAGTTDITKLEIKPSGADSFLDVTTAGFLDWAYDFTLDIDTSNQAVYFSEGGGAPITANLTAANYTLAALATELQTQLNASGALTYTVTVSAHDELVVSANGGFSLLGASGGVLPLVGFPATVAGKAAYTGAWVTQIQKTAQLKVTNAASPTPLVKTITRYVNVISEKADHLFSSDDQLRKHEPDILKWVADGRATFKDVHRRAQALIMAWLDTQGYIDDFASPLIVRRVKDTGEVSEWAAMSALKLIFEGIQNQKDDVFAIKAKLYAGREEFYRNRAVLRIDLNEDDNVVLGEALDIKSCVVVRR